MKNVRIEAMIPAKEVSEFISLVESVEGKVLALSLESDGRKRRLPSGSNRKPQVALTHEIAASILETKNKHPSWTLKQIGEKHNVSAESAGRVIRGTASILKQKKKKVSKKAGAK